MKIFTLSAVFAGLLLAGAAVSFFARQVDQTVSAPGKSEIVPSEVSMNNTSNNVTTPTAPKPISQLTSSDESNSMGTKEVDDTTAKNLEGLTEKEFVELMNTSTWKVFENEEFGVRLLYPDSVYFIRGCAVGSQTIPPVLNANQVLDDTQCVLSLFPVHSHEPAHGAFSVFQKNADLPAEISAENKPLDTQAITSNPDAYFGISLLERHEDDAGFSTYLLVTNFYPPYAYYLRANDALLTAVRLGVATDFTKCSDRSSFPMVYCWLERAFVDELLIGYRRSRHSTLHNLILSTKQRYR